MSLPLTSLKLASYSAKPAPCISRRMRTRSEMGGWVLVPLAAIFPSRATGLMMYMGAVALLAEASLAGDWLIFSRAEASPSG